MKFSEGFWRIPENMNIMHAMHIWDYTLDDKQVKLFLTPVKITHQDMQVNSPLLTLTISSAGENILRFKYTHFEGGKNLGPHFELHIQAQSLKTKEEEDSITIYHDDLRIECCCFPFSFAIYKDNKLLTKSSYKDVGYATLDNKEVYFFQRLGLDVGELVYGLGERFSSFVKNGQAIDIWHDDGGTSTMIAYKNIPFYLTNKSYGVFVNHPEKVSFEVASEHVTKTQFSVAGESLEYLFIAGDDTKDVITRYGKLTGFPALPPAWSFGLWLTTSFTTNYDENTINQFVEGMFERNIPLHVFHFDCFWMKGQHWCNFKWDEKAFPDPEAMLSRLKDKGLKTCVWINPYIAQLSTLFYEGKNCGYLLKKDENTIWQGDHWQAGLSYVDFTNPKATKWYQECLRKLVWQGVDSFKTDFGERIPVDVIYHDGSDPYKMHNYYTYLYNKAVFELLEEEKGKNNAALFARSATVGGQQFPVHWGGDCDATYEAMAETLRGGLSFGLAGFAFWSHDIGGFESTAPADLYKRWIAFGLLSSHSRLHGSKSYRVPWLYDEESVDVLRYFTRLKCRLMPYLYNSAIKSSQTAIPMLRPMMLEFMEDKNTHHLDCQYMLGDSLLVAPIFNKQGDVEVYLPKQQGKWTHLLSNQQKEGASWCKEKHDFMNLPLYVRSNSLIILGSNDTEVDYDYGQNFEAHLFELSDNKEIIADIPSAETGEIKAQIKIKRQYNKMTISMEGEITNGCLILRNIFSVVSVSCGKAKTTPLGIKIELKKNKGDIIISPKYV